MKPHLLVFAATLLLSSLTGCATDTESEPTDAAEGAAVGAAAKDDWYIVTRDAFELNASLFVKGLNLKTTICGDGKPAADCKVSNVDFENIGRPIGQEEHEGINDAIRAGDAIIHGRLVRRGSDVDLVASEIYGSVSDGAPSGTFFRVTELGTKKRVATLNAAPSNKDIQATTVDIATALANDPTVIGIQEKELRETGLIIAGTTLVSGGEIRVTASAVYRKL